MLSSRKKLIVNAVLGTLVTSPLILATVVSCANNANVSNSGTELPGNGGTTPEKPSQPGNSGTTTPPNSEQIPEFLQKELEQAKNLALNNQTWAKITDLNVERNVQNEVYETYLTRRYKDSFKYPAWDFNWEDRNQGNNGWQDVIDYEYPELEGQPTPYPALNGAPLLWNERTDFEVGKNDKGEAVFAKYNDPRFIINEIKTGTFKKHPAADKWFPQTINPTTKAVSKQFSVPTNALGSTALGLYAPAGEVVTLKFSQKTLSLMKEQNINNFQIIINESYWDNTSAGSVSDPGTVSNRYPFVQTTFNVDWKTLETTGGSFQFGSPFGGTISVRTNKRISKNTNNPFYQAYENYDFNVTGAVEMLSYMHNVTTEENWNAQIQRVKSGAISAPAMAIDLPLATANFAIIGAKNQFAGVPLEKLVFPKQAVDKWTSFMFVSEFLASRDKSGKLIKLTLRFCDDMWIQNAIAIAGGDQTALPVRWAGPAFLLGLETWNKLTNNWGIFHEVNHNFQQNSALFKKNSHGETNQVTMYVFSLLSDNGRFKNLWNPLGEFSTGEWVQRLSSGYNALQYINTRGGKGGSEYELPTILAYQFGSLNMLQYIRNDVYNAPNTASGWSGFKEIIQLSDTFKVNLWPAMNKFKSWWADGWDKTPPSDIEQELSRINSSYKKVDFVGNLFATGSYVYDQTSDQYLYTNDTSAPIQVATNVPYVFDFGKGINSFMNTVVWEELIFNKTTKLGGKLEQNPDNKKQLIYQPPANVYNQIDEFDIAIKPISNEENYIDQYKWKVKMNLVSNLPLVTMYNDPAAKNNNKNFINDWNYMKNSANFAFQAPVDPRIGIYAEQSYNTNNQWQKAKISFRFIAPETGQFNFKIKGDSWFFIDVDSDHKSSPDEIWWKATTVPVREFIDTSVLELKQGEAVKFDVFLTQRRLRNTLEMLANVNGNTYDVFDHSVTPLGEVSDDLLNFAYLPRYADQNLFQSNLLAPHQVTSIEMIDKNNYTFYDSKGSNWIDPKLTGVDKNIWETWAPSKNSPLTIDFRVDFNTPQQLGSIIFNHRTDNWYEARATKMIIKDQDDQVLYDDRYGIQFDDRNKGASIFNFKQPVSNISQLKLSLTNEKIVGNDKSAISLDAIQFSKNSYYKANQIVSMQDPAIQYYGPNWEVNLNDENVNVSGFSSTYVSTNGKHEKFETTFVASGFDIIGQKGPDLGVFELYVNDELVGVYDLSQTIRADQQLLASYRIAEWQNGTQLKIKLVNKSDKPIRFDAIQTYGNKVVLN